MRSILFTNTCKNNMKLSFKKLFNFSFVSRYRLSLIFYMSVCWTIVDLVMVITRQKPTYYTIASAIALRSILVFIMSLGIGYLLIFKLRRMYRNRPLAISFLFRSTILLIAAYIINFITHTANIMFTLHLGMLDALHKYAQDATNIGWITQKLLYWLALFVLTQL